MTATPPLSRPDPPPNPRHLLVLTGALTLEKPRRTPRAPSKIALRSRLFPDGKRVVKLEGENWEIVEIPRVSGICGTLSQDEALRENICYSSNNILVFLLENRFFKEKLSAFLEILQISRRTILVFETPKKKNQREIDRKIQLLRKKLNIPVVSEQEFLADKEAVLKSVINCPQNVCSSLAISQYPEAVQSALRRLKIAIQRDLPSSTIPAEWIAARLLAEDLEVQMELNRTFGRNIARTGETGEIWNKIQEKWKENGINRDFVRNQIHSVSRRLAAECFSQT